MIAHPLKTVFIHIPKTAGQTIEQVFLSYLGLDQNARPSLLLREKRDYEQGTPRLSHLTAADYVRCGYLTEQQYSDYFSFSFTRNPWARVRSFYNYMGFDEKMEFEDFVMRELEYQLRVESHSWFYKPQSDFLFDHNDKPLVDFVGRMESLQADFDTVMQHLKLPKTELPLLNSSTTVAYCELTTDLETRPIKSNVKTGFSTQSRDKVADLYARDTQLLGYEFIEDVVDD